MNKNFKIILGIGIFLLVSIIFLAILSSGNDDTSTADGEANSTSETDSSTGDAVGDNNGDAQRQISGSEQFSGLSEGVQNEGSVANEIPVATTDEELRAFIVDSDYDWEEKLTALTAFVESNSLNAIGCWAPPSEEEFDFSIFAEAANDSSLPDEMRSFIEEILEAVEEYDFDSFLEEYRVLDSESADLDAYAELQSRYDVAGYAEATSELAVRHRALVNPDNDQELCIYSLDGN